MKGVYELRAARADGVWDAFVAASPQGTIYATSACLLALRTPPALYYCSRGDEMVAAVIAQLGNATNSAQSDLLIYGGILLAPTPAPTNDARTVLSSFRTTEFIVAELARRHEWFQMQLSPAFADIRPFLWHNYGTSLPRFDVGVRYTSYLDISNVVGDEAEALRSLRTLRRREIRRAQGSGLLTREEFDAGLCAELYRLTMARQNQVAAPAELDEMKAVMRALHSASAGRMFVTRNAAGDAASAVFMGVDAKRGYFMFGGSDPSLRGEASGTIVFWEAFQALRQSGSVSIDMEGINSPNRGWFKLSFGGTIMPYFRLELDQRTER